MTVRTDHPAAVARAVEALAAGPGVAGRVELDAPLGARTTYRVGGPAAVLVTVVADGELAAVARAARDSGLPVLTVGKGSNLLVADAGFPGIAVVLDAADDAYGGIAVDGSVVVAGAAVPLPLVARRSVEAGLTGMEWAVGVPGSVGGGVRMNAGGHGSDMAATLARAWIADLGRAGAVDERAVVDLAYAYRNSAVAADHVVLRAEFALAPGDREKGRAELAEIVRWSRREHQPGGQNAGSVFTNPPGQSAGAVIEAAGLKGHRVGTAAVSTKHANFIQADSGGSADDVRALIRTVQRAVRDRFGVELHPEVRTVGFPVPAELDLKLEQRLTVRRWTGRCSE